MAEGKALNAIAFFDTREFDEFLARISDSVTPQRVGG